MKAIPRSIKRQLRELANQAHENELNRELAQLTERFDEWREGKICAGELSHLIHQYHNGPARDLYKQYNNLPVEMLVAQAVVHGILQERDVPEKVWPYIESSLEFCRSHLGEDGT